MNTHSRIRKTIWTIASGLLVLALTAAMFVAVPATTAYADDGTPPSGERSRDRGALLERAFEREKDWLARQGDNLAKAEAGADKLAELIEKAKANGIDTSELETALAQFKGQMARAEHTHDEAAAIIDAHAGFNGGGKVTDAAQALELRQAGPAVVDIDQAGDEVLLFARLIQQAQRRMFVGRVVIGLVQLLQPHF